MLDTTATTVDSDYPRIAPDYAFKDEIRIGREVDPRLLADADVPGGLEVEITSRPVTVEVRPLPPPPAGYEGAVPDGQVSGAVRWDAGRADGAVQPPPALGGAGHHLPARRPPPAAALRGRLSVVDELIEKAG